MFFRRRVSCGAGYRMPRSTDEQPERRAEGSGAPAQRPGTGRSTGLLGLAALGVVFGDIGTSPLYALKVCFSEGHLEPVHADVMGVLSLIFWSLLLVIGGKYLLVLLRLDSRGEGGICAMLELVRGERLSRKWQVLAIGATVGGAALLFGDGVITPAISVLSALEGLGEHSTEASRYTMPVAVVVLFLLFAIQRFGTGRIGILFGPVMLLWFLAIGVFGAVSIAENPGILAAVDPRMAFLFVHGHAGPAFVVLGAVVLVVTGGEALYADLGHFGKRPIRLAWLFVVWPSLVLSYFGQGARLLHDPSARENPFFAIVPEVLLWPMIVLATFAAVIASQAIISGLFSLARQAVNLKLLPALKVVHTSPDHIGQIYVPVVNMLLGICCIVLVVVFHRSDALAAAYGLAVTGMMAISTLMFMLVARVALRWPVYVVFPLGLAFLSIDLLFLSANALKILDGGWIPLTIAFFVIVVMSTWLRGVHSVIRQFRNRSVSFTAFRKSWPEGGVERIPGTGIFLTSLRIGIPASVTTFHRNLKVLHEKVVLLSFNVEEIPFVDEDQRIRIYRMPEDFWHVTVRHGYLDEVNAPRIVRQAIEQGLPIDEETATYFVRQEIVDITGRSRLARWRRRLFLILHRNAWPSVWAFCLPPNRTIAIGIVVRV